MLLGDGMGNFTLASSPATGDWPTSVAVDDFNSDGKTDLAVLNQHDWTASILLGDGAGSFTLTSSPSVDSACGYPSTLATGDFNADGKLDLAIVSAYSSAFCVLLGNGDGTFQPSEVYTTGTEPTSVAVGDFNGDGKLDLAIANHGYDNRYDPSNDVPSSVSILRGNGDGTFRPRVDYPTHTAYDSPSGLIAADVNGDGRLDLAFAENEFIDDTDCLYLCFAAAGAHRSEYSATTARGSG